MIKMAQEKKNFFLIGLIASCFGIYRIIHLHSSILLFLRDPFYLDSLTMRLAKEIITQNEFLLILLYMNINLFVIFFCALLFILMGLFLMREKIWARKTIFYLSVALLFYSFAEIALFPWMTVLETQKIVIAISFLAGLKEALQIFYPIPIYIFFIVSCNN